MKVSPIELIFGSLLIVFILIGVIRGYPKELGVTITVLVALYLLIKVDQRQATAVSYLGRALEPVGVELANETTRQLVLFSLYTLFLVAMVFIAYEGITLDFPGARAQGPYETLLNLGSGLLNGYLVVGTIWYYLDKFEYPTEMIGLFKSPLTDFAEKVIPLLPQYLLGDKADWYFLAFLLLLLILRVIK
jgi:uncharacterized membrane protein required for colicin V production